MKRLSSLQAPALAGVIREETTLGAIAEIKNCLYGGAKMIDLHMSCLKDRSDNALKEIINCTKLPVLALNYNQKCDWSSAGFSEEEREELFFRAVKLGASGVDIQGYTFDLPSKTEFKGEDKYSFTKNKPKEVVTDYKIIKKQCNFIEKVHSMGAEVLLSCHTGLAMKCNEVVDLALFLQERNPDIIKIVTVANNDDDLLESLKTMLAIKREVKTPVVYHASGVAGRLSRVLNPLLGGHMAFCVNGYKESATMEQIDLQTAKLLIDNLNKIR